jgi:Ca-activated chloride channel family protein
VFSVLTDRFAEIGAQWSSLRVGELQFWHRTEARLALAAMVSLTIVLLIARSIIARRAGRNTVVLPALVGPVPRSRVSAIVHFPILLFIAGLPFFLLALSDPFTALVSSEATYPGRRIGLMIDASISMRTPFTAATLNKRNLTEATFFTTVAAAERFVQLRMKSQYRDLIALVEFGNQAYVVTPFTNDYDNILLSISLIGDPVEFSRFPDQGTVIASGIDESVELFRAFNFLEASGNLMVIFTDGEDTNAMVQGKSLDSILQGAIDARVPVYLVRTNYAHEEGQLIPDALWVPAVQKTGGKFYAASDEKSLLAAIADIDRVSAGTIQLKRYTSQEPRYAMFTIVALALWTAAAALKLAVPAFRRFP